MRASWASRWGWPALQDLSTIQDEREREEEERGKGGERMNEHAYDEYLQQLKLSSY